MQTDGSERRSETSQYEIDPVAVAAAIVARLLAGRTVAPAGADDRA